MKRILWTAVTIASLGIMNSALAAVQLPMGWYLEGNVGASRLSNVNLGNVSQNSSSVAYGVNAGYKFMPFFATEGGGIKYANITAKNNAGVNVASDKIYSINLAGKGIWPISPGFELFAKLGVAYLHSHLKITNSSAAYGLGIPSGTHTKTGAYLGVGADYSYLPNVPIILQWTRARGDNATGTLDFYSIGVAYIFG